MRKTHEAHSWHDADKINRDDDFKLDNNESIREQWSIATIDSMVFTERIRFLINAKLNGKAACLFDRDSAGQEISNAIGMLSNLKNEIVFYNGRNIYKQIAAKQLRSKNNDLGLWILQYSGNFKRRINVTNVPDCDENQFNYKKSICYKYEISNILRIISTAKTLRANAALLKGQKRAQPNLSKEEETNNAQLRKIKRLLKSQKQVGETNK